MVCISDSTSDNVTIFHFSQSFSFKLFLFLATTSSAFSDCAFSMYLRVAFDSFLVRFHSFLVKVYLPVCKIFLHFKSIFENIYL